MKKILIICLGMLFSQVAFALDEVKDMPEGIYFNDKNHTSVTFKVSHMGLSNYTARFSESKAELIFDPKYPELSKVTAVVYPSSIKTDYPEKAKIDFDKKLAIEESWFNVIKYPEVRFESKMIQKTSEDTGVMTGDLTMLGVTKSVDFRVVFNGAYKSKPIVNLPALGFSATAKIKRSDWGFNNYVPVIGDEVEIIVEIEFHKELVG